MDRDLKRRIRIEEFLDWDNDNEIAEDAIEVLKALVSKKPAMASSIIAKISLISSAAINAIDNERKHNWGTVEEAVQLMHMYSNPTDRQWVIAATQVVKTLFPNGHCKEPWRSEVTEKFFKKWLVALKGATSLIDSDWAKRQKFNDYFKMALDLDKSANKK